MQYIANLKLILINIHDIKTVLLNLSRCLRGRFHGKVEADGFEEALPGDVAPRFAGQRSRLAFSDIRLFHHL